MSRWPAAVAAEPKTLHMFMDADARLAAAAGGVARFLADEAGLETAAAARLQMAVVEACREDFKFLAADHSHLEVTFARFSNRLEISLSHQQQSASPSGLKSAGRPGNQKDENKANPPALMSVDLIQHEVRGKEIVTRLTKFFGGDPYPSST